jgi:tetratricopeptide (TPR) repeat protein
LAHESRQYETAISHYLGALRLNPGHTEARGNLGIALAGQGKFVEAMNHYERILTLNPEHAETHNNLAVALAAQGRLSEAITHYQRAIKLKFACANLHNNLGLALSAQGRLEGAIPSYQQAVALNPSLASAHNNLGVALADQGRIGEAIDHYRRALALQPDYANAYNNLGVALLKQGKVVEAGAAYEQALVISPNHASAHANLGAALADQGHLPDAVLHLEQALALDPAHAPAYNTLGKIRINQGNFNEALEYVGRAIALKPDYAEAHLNRAQVKSFRRGDPELAALEELATSNLSPQKAVYIHFALAKALEDTQDYVRAFGQRRKGNALKRAQINYDEATALRQFQRLSTVFDGRVFERFRGAGDPSPVPVFIVGMPRSGSTLVEQILASHPQIHGAGELTDFAEVVKGVLQEVKPPLPYPECVATLDATTFHRIGQAYLSRLTALSVGTVRIADKLPGNFLNIGLIQLTLPNARIIHTVRHPVATCLSCYSKLFTSCNDYTYDLGGIRPLLPPLPGVDDALALRSCPAKYPRCFL